MDKYQQQRIGGAKQIIIMAHRLARAANIPLDKLEWDKGQQIVERPIHVLTVTSGVKSVTAEFSDDWLADYPGRVGTEKANHVLAGIIHQLSQ